MLFRSVGHWGHGVENSSDGVKEDARVPCLGSRRRRDNGSGRKAYTCHVTYAEGSNYLEYDEMQWRKQNSTADRDVAAIRAEVAVVASRCQG